MKLLWIMLAVAAVVEVSTARKVLKRNEFKQKYRLHREPLSELPAALVEDGEVVVEKWIEQRLNNLDPRDNRTWQMRYLENNFFLTEGGPIFIDVGGEWTISAGSLLNSHLRDMARQLNGTMFYTEHRYYGKSHPTPDVSLESLRFLNVNQALADLAHFIVHIKQTIPEVRNSGVILVGGSYSATMVTWFMQKYPHLANGAWASSAPIQAKVDFFEYKDVVSQSIDLTAGTSCTTRIRNAFRELERLVEQGNLRRIEEVFRLCYPLNIAHDLDIGSFFASIADPWSGIVQYHDEISQDIQQECDIFMNNEFESNIEAMSYWFWHNEIDPENPEDICFDHRYEAWKQFLKGTNWDDLAAGTAWRQWYYQTCSEYGWYDSSMSDDKLFGSFIPYNVSLQYCQDVYDFSTDGVHQNVDRTNVMYGAFNPNVRNVYSTHGQLDPWSSMGVQVNINEWSPTVVLPMESHCADLGPIREYNTPEMIASKERIFELVQQWLGLSVD